MGPVNWMAVCLAALAAAGLGWIWYRRLDPGRPAPAASLALLIVPASLIGHNFARVGGATLAAKPWLYFMMSGGFALTMVLPALAITHGRLRLGRRAVLIDGGYVLAAYLLIGGVFFLLR